MPRIEKDKGATNALIECFATRKTRAKDITPLQGLQALRDIALFYARKYRLDPVLGRTHEEYLTLLNGFLKDAEND